MTRTEGSVLLRSRGYRAYERIAWTRSSDGIREDLKLRHRPPRRSARAPIPRMTRAARRSRSPPLSPLQSPCAEHAVTSRPAEHPAPRAARAESAPDQFDPGTESAARCRQKNASCAKSSAERFPRVKIESRATARIGIPVQPNTDWSSPCRVRCLRMTPVNGVSSASYPFKATRRRRWSGPCRRSPARRSE